MKSNFKILVKGFALMGVFGLLLSCGGGGGGGSTPQPISHTFTTCSATGATGPDQAACDTDYTGTSLEGLVAVTGAFQRWTAPRDGTYQIDVYGAQGASADASFVGGLGAHMGGDFVLTIGQMLDIVVGQAGIDDSPVGNNGGGGGGSFVVDVNTGLPLIVAGGGGGVRNGALQNGCDGRISEEAGTGSGSSVTHTCDPRVGGIGDGGIISSSSWGSAGGGFNTDGAQTLVLAAMGTEALHT